MIISKMEKWMIVIIALLMWIALALLAGGPVFSDEMLYIDAGLRNIAEPNYGNRYFHIYLQKFFVSIFPTPLIGIRVFWGFLISLTVALTYLNARRIFSHSTILHGLMASAIFFSFSLVKGYSGEPAVDITAMAMTTIYLTIYLWVIKRPEKSRIGLFLLGTLAFLGLKTKETTIFINILLLGFLSKKFKEIYWPKKVIRFFTPFTIGILTGILVFIILDGLILKKPFFAISPSTFSAVFSNYDFEPGFFFGPTSWYRVYLFDDLLLPFLLFLISGIQLQQKAEDAIRIVWVYPLIFVAFLSWNMLKVPWGFIERFYFPALPVIAILAPQTIRFEWPKKKHDWLWFFLSLVISMLLLIILRSVWKGIAQDYYFDYGRILDAIYFPILISILLSVLIWEKSSGWKRSTIHIFCIASLLITPLSNNFKYFAIYPKIQERYDLVFYPFIKFGEYLEINESDQIYISTDIKRSQEMLSDDPNDITGMYNFFFDARISDKNVFIGYNRKKVANDLLTCNFEYALLSAYDIEQLKRSQVWDAIMNEYEKMYSDEDESIFLLFH